MRKPLFFVLLFFSLTVAAEQRPLVQVAIMNFPGYAEWDENGQAAGKTVTLSRKLLNEAGYDSEYKILPAARIWLGLKNGDVDVWPGLVNKPGLAGHTLITERDLGQVGINLYYRPDTPKPSWPEGMRDKSVIVITNFTYTTGLQEVLTDADLGLNLYRSGSHAGALEMLMRGRGDYLLDYRSQIKPALQRQGMQALPNIQVAVQPMRFVLSRRNPLASQLHKDLDAAFDRLQAAGVELNVTRQ